MAERIEELKQFVQNNSQFGPLTDGDVEQIVALMQKWITEHAPGSKPAPATSSDLIEELKKRTDHYVADNVCGSSKRDWLLINSAMLIGANVALATEVPKPAADIDYERALAALSTIEYWNRCDLANSDRQVRRRMGELARKTLEGDAGAEPAPAGTEKPSREPHDGWINSWLFRNVPKDQNCAYVWNPEARRFAGDWADFRLSKSDPAQPLPEPIPNVEGALRKILAKAAEPKEK